MPLIDAHINLTHDGRWFHTGLDASADEALRQMDQAGIEMAGVITPPGSENRAFAMALGRRKSDRFFVGFTIQDTSDTEYQAMKEGLATGPFRFVKVHPRWTGILPRSPELQRFLDLAERHSTPVLFCSYMRGPRLPMAELQPLVFDDIARTRPGLKIVLGHAGSYRPLDALAVAQSHENVYLDVSHVLEYFRNSSVEQDLKFLMNRIDRRLLFGSDFPEYRIGDYLDRARALTEDFESFEREGFFGNHAATLYLGK